LLGESGAPDGFWSASFAERLTAAHMALTPTLTLWDVEAKKGNASSDEVEKGMSIPAPQLEAFSQAGGQVLFGTDVGYIEQFDTTEEFTWMSRAGMDFQKILASLTTNPAQRFGCSNRSGRIAKGMDADLVVLSADPGQNITAFSQVRYTIREGRVIYSKK
jgi:imidazolonepropionase-like amidohydrolase